MIQTFSNFLEQTYLNDSNYLEFNIKSCYIPIKSKERIPMDCSIPWVENWIIGKVNEKGNLNVQI